MGKAEEMGGSKLTLGIDPGDKKSAYCLLNGGLPHHFDVVDNYTLLDRLENYKLGQDCNIAIEMIASYGMPVGREVFETCLWIGRFWERCDGDVEFVYRKDVKMFLCHSMKAKDANVRQAIIDRFEPIGGGKIPQIGTKSKPGPLYGVRSDIWSALGVAMTYEGNRVKA